MTEENTEIDSTLLINKREFAKISGLSEATVYRRVKNGKIKTYLAPGRISTLLSLDEAKRIKNLPKFFDTSTPE